MEGSTADPRRVTQAESLAETRAPDVVDEILGWKVLAVGEEGTLGHHLGQMHNILMPTALTSPMSHETRWPIHGWLHATCWKNPEHLPPEEDCTCGIYAVSDLKRAQRYLREAPLTVLVRVALAGKVIPGTWGWRAERARIVALTETGVGKRDYPGMFARVRRRYAIPVLDLDVMEA